MKGATRAWTRGAAQAHSDQYDDQVIRSVTATELKATILAVLDEVADGGEVEVTKRGRPVARIVPIRSSRDLRGRFVGIAATAVDEDGIFSTGQAWDAE